MEKALTKISLTAVQKKIKYGQGLTAKEFAVATGFAYCSARAMFKDPEFPAFRRAGTTPLLFWSDWETYRRRQTGMSRRQRKAADPQTPPAGTPDGLPPKRGLPAGVHPRVARALASIG